MELPSSPSVPMILHPGCERDWAHQQHALDHTLRWTEAKQTDSLPLRRSSVLSLKRQASQPEVARRTDKRRRINRPVVITKQRSAVDKNKSAGDWEHLLKSSLQSLQGLYEKMDVPVAPKSQVLGNRFPIGLMENDPATVASKAMHHAAGCCSEGGINEDDIYNSSSSETDDASDSDYTSEGPATPEAGAMQIDEDVDIDIELTPRAYPGVPSLGAYSHLR
ncbi:hypothetical protein VM1G_01281 [Cytospora mali]|uniref:Uncharacterized protein n=1 Tax=Cytospora mali TaxID=578113 RepID=A0A194VLN1_CYTMA|nr:hypothetical protein VM1G_01281 [Valsa mali]